MRNIVNIGSITAVQPTNVSDADYDPATFHNSERFVNGVRQSGQFAYTWRIATTVTGPTSGPLLWFSGFLPDLVIEGPTNRVENDGSFIGPSNRPYRILLINSFNYAGGAISYRHVSTDPTPPQIASIELTTLDRVFPNIDRTSSGEATWTVTFDEPVKGVASTHFAVSYVDGNSYTNFTNAPITLT